jgi:hypothetical protein
MIFVALRDTFFKLTGSTSVVNLSTMVYMSKPYADICAILRAGLCPGYMMPETLNLLTCIYEH